jgi:5,5'-dehydrodivanillate O-demethylase
VREKRKARARSVATETTAQLGEAILAGNLRAQDTIDRWNGVEVEDYATLVGQGAIAPRADDHLGRSDVGVILIRRLWERELRVLAEGRPLKRWFRPEKMEMVVGSD